MSLLDIGGISLFDDELDFLVPLSDSPQSQMKLLSFDDSNSNLMNDDAEGIQMTFNTSFNNQTAPNDQRKRSNPVQRMVSEERGEETKESFDIQSWLGIDAVDSSTNSSSLMNPNLAFLTASGNGVARSSSPNPRTKKKVKTALENSLDGSDEHFEDEADGSKASPPFSNGNCASPARRMPLRSASFGYDLNMEATGFADPNRYSSLLNSTGLSSPYAQGNSSPSNSWFNSVPVKSENFEQQQRRTVPVQGRRRSISGRPTISPPSYQSLRVPEAPHLELDANYAKVQLMEMGYPVQKKDPKGFCHQVVNFICQYSKIFVGGFYLNNNQTQSPAASWILSCTYPSPSEFNQYFHYNVGERFIVQAAMEKRCFCVHSSSWENNSGLLSFLFVPIPNESSNSNALAVMVLGTILAREEDLHTHLLFLDQVRRPIASILKTLLHIQHNLYLLQKLEALQYESDTGKQVTAFDKALVNVLSGLKTDGDENPVICTNLKGMISYFSNAAQRLLGYTAEELIGKHALIQLHDLLELNERSKELEQEVGRPFPADFNVLIQKTVANRGADDTRVWHWIRKDRSLVTVQVTIKPLNDESSVFGFVAVAKEVLQNQVEPMYQEDQRK